MSKIIFRRAVVTAIVLCTFSVIVYQGALAQTNQTSAVSEGMEAIDAASIADKHIFIFFWKADDDQYKKMFPIFKSAMKNIGEAAHSISVDITTPEEAPLVKEYGLSRMPMPLVLALAPNGAVSGCYPLNFDEKSLRQGITSSGLATCLKALQDRKLVLLCVQDESMPAAKSVISAAKGFKANPQYGAATVVININPTDESEQKLLGSLKIDPKTTKVVTVLLAPPGRSVARFEGPVTTEQIVAKIKASSTCGPNGCGPGGCCPK